MTVGRQAGVQIGPAEGAGRDGRRKRSEATRNEEKEMRWLMAGQGVVTQVHLHAKRLEAIFS